MGTYTSNYNLFLPTIGEQGWGDLVNGNFTTIDTTMSGLNTRIGTLETEADAFDSRIGTLESTIPEEGVIDAQNVIANTLSLPLNVNGNLIVYENMFASFYVENEKAYTSPTFSLPNSGTLRYLGTYTFTIAHNAGSGYTRTFEIYVDGVLYDTFTHKSTQTDKDVYNIYEIPVESSIYFKILYNTGVRKGTATVTCKI